MLTTSQKTIAAAICAAAALSFASCALAQDAATTTPGTTSTPGQPAPVTFTVTVGPLSCKNGSGTAQVNFANDPTVGGYYEVFGEMIVKNGIALGRKVDLPSGEYTWKGDVNDGYYAVGATNGSFTVPPCSSASTALPAQTLTTPSSTSTPVEQPTTNTKPTVQSKPEVVPQVGETATATGTVVVPPNEEKGGWGTLQSIVAVLAALGIVFAFASRKSSAQK